MLKFLENQTKNLKYASLVVMLITPFLLYFAATKDMAWAENILLVLMGLSMLVALKVG
jgi:hypothetical protein